MSKFEEENDINDVDVIDDDEDNDSVKFSIRLLCL